MAAGGQLRPASSGPARRRFAALRWIRSEGAGGGRRGAGWAHGLPVRCDFRAQDRAAVAAYLKDRCGVELTDTEASCSGKNYGDLHLGGARRGRAGEAARWRAPTKRPLTPPTAAQSLALTLDGKTTFDVALSEVSQCANPGKGGNELELQFHEDDTGNAEVRGESLRPRVAHVAHEQARQLLWAGRGSLTQRHCRTRPSWSCASLCPRRLLWRAWTAREGRPQQRWAMGQRGRQEEGRGRRGGMDLTQSPSSPPRPQALQKAISDKAGIGAVAGDLIVEFEASFLMPRCVGGKERGGGRTDARSDAAHAVHLTRRPRVQRHLQRGNVPSVHAADRPHVRLQDQLQVAGRPVLAGEQP